LLLVSLALDAASLLGGNEYMVGQLLQSQNKKSFSPEDQIVINWALEVLWGQKVYDEFSKTNQVVDGQKVFTSLFHPNVQVASKKILKGDGNFRIWSPLTGILAFLNHGFG
jgi:hypothetical protein